MVTTRLPRETLPEITAEELDRLSDQLVERGTAELARDAKELLGYPSLATTIEEEAKTTKQKQRHQLDNARLANILHRLDIRPFNTAAVGAYKAAVVVDCEKKENDRFDSKSGLRKTYELTIVLIALVSFAACLLLLLTGFTLLIVGHWYPAFLPKAVFYFSAAIISICSFVASVIIAGVTDVFPKHYIWTRTDLNQYQEPVPEFVLQTAVLVKKELLEDQWHKLTFSVDHLAEKPDPFLVVQLGTSDPLYIEQWDESNFKAKREV